MIDGLFYEFEKDGVMWSREHMPKVREEAEAHMAMQRNDTVVGIVNKTHSNHTQGRSRSGLFIGGRLEVDDSRTGDEKNLNKNHVFSRSLSPSANHTEKNRLSSGHRALFAPSYVVVHEAVEVMAL